MKIRKKDRNKIYFGILVLIVFGVLYSTGYFKFSILGSHPCCSPENMGYYTIVPYDDVVDVHVEARCQPTEGCGATPSCVVVDGIPLV